MTDGLPHDHEAEQAVLGAMMLSIDALDAITEIVDGRDFYRPAHETIFKAIVGLREIGEPVDARTVAAALAESGDLQRVGAVLYLHACIESVPTVANGAYYARIVADRALSRRLVEAGQRIAQLGLRSGGLAGAGVDLSSAVELSQEAVFGINHRGADDFMVLGDMLETTLDDIEKAAGNGDDVMGVPTGFSDLDRLLNGLHPGQLDHRRRAAGAREVDGGHGFRPARGDSPQAGVGDLLFGDVESRDGDSVAVGRGPGSVARAALGSAHRRRLVAAGETDGGDRRGSDLPGRHPGDEPCRYPGEGAAAQAEARPEAAGCRLPAADEFGEAHRVAAAGSLGSVPGSEAAGEGDRVPGDRRFPTEPRPGAAPGQAPSDVGPA